MDLDAMELLGLPVGEVRRCCPSHAGVHATACVHSLACLGPLGADSCMRRTMATAGVLTHGMPAQPGAWRGCTRAIAVCEQPGSGGMCNAHCAYV